MLEGDLLHGLLCKECTECVGVDLDQVGIAELGKIIPGVELHVCNAEDINKVPPLAGRKWEFIVAGDVVEHMDNPGKFFAAARDLLNDDGVLIVTVPSAFSIKRFVWLMLTGREQVHPDHTAYFSESTLTTVGKRNGFSISRIAGFQWRNATLWNRLTNTLVMPFIWASGGRGADELLVEFMMDR